MTPSLHTQRLHLSRGFSLIEVLVVITVFTLISSASYPIIKNFGDASAYGTGKARAEALTAAKILYARQNPDAESEWNTAEDDEAKFTLLKPYLEGLDAGTTLSQFAADAPYHQFNLGTGLRERASLIEPEDA